MHLPPMASHSTCLLDILVLGSLTKTLKRWELGRRRIPLALNSPCPLSFSYHPPSVLHCQPGTCRSSGILTLLSKCGLHWATAKPASQLTGAGGRGPGRTRLHPRRWGATAKLLWSQGPPPDPLSPPRGTYVQVCVGHSEMCLSGCRGEVLCGKMSRAIVKIWSFIFGKPKALLSSCPGPGEDPLSWRPRSLDQGSHSAPWCTATGLRTDLRDTTFPGRLGPALPWAGVWVYRGCMGVPLPRRKEEPVWASVLVARVALKPTSSMASSAPRWDWEISLVPAWENSRHTQPCCGASPCLRSTAGTAEPRGSALRCPNPCLQERQDGPRAPKLGASALSCTNVKLWKEIKS